MKQMEIKGLGLVLFDRSRRSRRLTVTVCRSGNIRVTVPRGVSYRQGEEFLESKRKWVDKQLKKIERFEKKLAPLREQVDQIDRQSASRLLANRLGELAALNGFTFNKVSIRNQKTRWGSCSTSNNISLNVKLILLPEHLRDYVMLHELVHTRVKDHSASFWTELGKYVTDPRASAAELKGYGLVLL